MTDLVTVAVIGALAGCFSAVTQAVTVFKVNKLQAVAARNEEHAKATSATVQQTQTDLITLKTQTNGITEALVKVVGQAEHAKGKLEGIAEEKANGH